MNLFELPARLGGEGGTGILWETPDLRVERIVSTGQVSPEGFWYDQEEDEWVSVLEGEGEVEFPGGEKRRLKRGDTLFLPAHLRHRVSFTTARPPCVWLGVFGRRDGRADSR